MALHVPKDPVYNNLLEACDEGPFIRDADQKRFQISAARLEGLLADKGIRSPIFVPSGGLKRHLHAKLVYRDMDQPGRTDLISPDAHFLQFVVVKPAALEAYQSSFPQLLFITLPSDNPRLVVGNARHWIKALATHLQLNAQRQASAVSTSADTTDATTLTAVTNATTFFERYWTIDDDVTRWHRGDQITGTAVHLDEALIAMSNVDVYSESMIAGFHAANAFGAAAEDIVINGDKTPHCVVSVAVRCSEQYHPFAECGEDFTLARLAG